MNFVNATKLAAGFNVAMDKTGREWLVVVAKGTYGFPDYSDREPPLLDEQVPLVMTDEFTGEPGLSAPLCENDFAPRKPRCDVLLNGSAYAPSGRPATKVQVTMQVGALTKSFNVFGNRVWQSSTLYMSPSSPEPFTVMPLSYNNAYGGVDKPGEDPNTHQWYLLNHVGVGFHPKTPAKALAGKPLPNTEETNNAIARPDGNYKPMAFGPIGRAWQQRVKWAGTYGQKWMDDQFPLLPEDFDDRYFQTAPDDQQTDYLRGGEVVSLKNLTPRGHIEFKLPWIDLPIDVFYKNGERKKIDGVVDTLLLEPNQKRFMQCVRASVALRRNLHEIQWVVAGRMPSAWYEQQGLYGGKRRFDSLADLDASNKGGK